METDDRKMMENSPRPGNPLRLKEPSGGKSGRIFSGLIIVAIGMMVLANRMGIDFPEWIFSWGMLLIALGVFVGIRHSFRGPVWLVAVIIGSILLLGDIDRTLDFEEYIWPMVIIAVGLVIMFRPKKKHMEPLGWDANLAAPSSSPSSDDTIDSVIIFGGVKKKIISKTFRGGELTTIFGGSELDLTQADVPHRIELELTQIFGGTKLIVPPHWRIQSDDLVSIFGGMDDKRAVPADVMIDPGKVLVLRGTCIFGGIDIKSF
jgi:hypothetical protein